MSDDPLTVLFTRLPRGYAEVTFEGQRWGVTSTSGDDGRRFAFTAEQLGGADGIGANLYVTSGGEQLRPCEVPTERVLDFLRTAEVTAARRDPSTGHHTGWQLLRRRRGLLGLLDRLRWRWRFRGIGIAAGEPPTDDA